MVYIFPSSPRSSRAKRPPKGAFTVSSNLLFQRRSGREKPIVVKPFSFNINNNNNNDDNEEEEIKKKKKSRRKKMIKESKGTVDNDISNTITSHLLDNNDDIISSCRGLIDYYDLVCDILSRLPAKSLIRFKCVCKDWLLLIQQDTHLHDLHLKRSITKASKAPPRLLIINQYQDEFRYGKDHNENWFLSANLFVQDSWLEAIVAINTIRIENSWGYDRILKPVNGLICFINFKSVFAVRVCNLCTREATPWIESTLLMEQKEKYDDVEVFDQAPKYGFGFNPATKEHKVICVWKISRYTKGGSKCRKIQASHGVKSRACVKQRVSICEILTVGQNTWRRINKVPLYNLNGESVYTNGTIYWIDCGYLKKKRSDDDNPEVIVAFDVGSEKFRVIPISFIFDQARRQGRKFGWRPSLFEFDGHVALSFGNCRSKVKMWISNDDFDKKKDNITSNSNRNWTKLTIGLPDTLSCSYQCQELYFHVVAGTDQIILVSYKGRKRTPYLYCYNQKMKSSKDVVISGISSSPFKFSKTNLLATFVESLFPVGRHRTQVPPGK